MLGTHLSYYCKTVNYVCDCDVLLHLITSPAFTDQPEPEAVRMQQTVFRYWGGTEGGGRQRHSLLLANLPAGCRSGKHCGGWGGTKSS